MSPAKTKQSLMIIIPIVGIIIAVSGFIIGNSQATSTMSKEYVRLERYKCDIERIEKLIKDNQTQFMNKIDKIDSIKWNRGTDK